MNPITSTAKLSLVVLLLLLVAGPGHAQAHGVGRLVELVTAGQDTRGFDLDGDRVGDTVRLGSGAISIDLEGEPTDVWLEAPAHDASATLVVGDVDGDADVDLVLTDISAGGLCRRVWINDGRSHFQVHDEDDADAAWCSRQPVAHASLDVLPPSRGNRGGRIFHRAPATRPAFPRAESWTAKVDTSVLPVSLAHVASLPSRAPPSLQIP